MVSVILTAMAQQADAKQREESVGKFGRTFREPGVGEATPARGVATLLPRTVKPVSGVSAE